MPEQTLHQSVLLNEVVEVLGPIHGGYYLDATFGNGGYSRAILDARLIARFWQLTAILMRSSAAQP